MGLKHLLQASAWAICLASANGALADNTGWFFSRANCLTANESITWKIDAAAAVGVTVAAVITGKIIPPESLAALGIPAYRKTSSVHRHRHAPGKDHSHQSSATLVWTWRAHAGSFPIPEAFPYVYVEVRWQTVWSWDDWFYGIPLISVPYLVIVVDHTPWSVSGTHYERTSANAATVTRTSYATGCNWGDTFNSM